MPVYNYHCDNCDNEMELFNTVSNRESALCGRCFKPMRKTISPIARPVVYEYFSENLNAYVTGPRQKQRLLKEKNMSEAS